MSDDLRIREYGTIKFPIHDINDVDIFRNVNVNNHNVNFNMRFEKKMIKVIVNMIL